MVYGDKVPGLNMSIIQRFHCSASGGQRMTQWEFMQIVNEMDCLCLITFHSTTSIKQFTSSVCTLHYCYYVCTTHIITRLALYIYNCKR